MTCETRAEKTIPRILAFVMYWKSLVILLFPVNWFFSLHISYARGKNHAETLKDSCNSDYSHLKLYEVDLTQPLDFFSLDFFSLITDCLEDTVNELGFDEWRLNTPRSNKSLRSGRQQTTNMRL